MYERMNEREIVKMEKQLLKKIEKSKKLSWNTIKTAIALDGLMHIA